MSEPTIEVEESGRADESIEYADAVREFEREIRANVSGRHAAEVLAHVQSIMREATAPDPTGIVVPQHTVHIDPELRELTSVAASQGYEYIPAEMERITGKGFVMHYGERSSRSGVPMSSGIIRTDHNPKLESYTARGFRDDKGVWEKLATVPVISNAIEGPIKDVAGLRWEVERMPEERWWGVEEKALAEKHYRFIAQAVSLWGDDAVANMVEGFLRTTTKRGFSVHEIVTEVRPVKLDPSLPTLLMEVPTVPRWISPSAVAHWITSHDRPVAVDFDFSSSNDAGGSGASKRLIPWTKLIHVGYRAHGANFEGESAIRPVYQEARMYRTIRQLQVLAVEVNALGDKVVELSEDIRGRNLKALREHFKRFVARVIPYLLLPKGAKYTWHSANNSIPDFTNILKELKADISTGVDNLSSLIGIINSGSSFALKKETSADARKSYQWLVRTLAGYPVQWQLFRRMIEIAFPGERPFPPLFRPEDVSQRDTQAWASTVSTLASAPGPDGTPVLWRSDPIGQEARKRVGLPADLDADELEGGGAPGFEDEEELPNAPGAPQAPRASAGGCGCGDPTCGGRSSTARAASSSSFQWVTDRDGSLVAVSRPLRPYEEGIGLAAIQNLYQDAEELAARSLRLSAGEHEVWLKEELPDGELTDAIEERLEGEARERFLAEYRTAARGSLTTFAADAIRDLEAEVRSNGLLNGSSFVRPRINVTGRAASIAREAFNRTHGHMMDRATSGAEVEVLAESTYRSIVRKHLSAVMSLARRKAYEANADNLRGGTVVRSSVLDSNSCQSCKDLDGRRFALGSAEYKENEPPRHCDGFSNCRCLYVLIGDDEG